MSTHLKKNLSNTTIEMKSSFTWNQTCPFPGDDSTILYNAIIVEQSLFDLIDSELKENQNIVYVLVTEICNRTVPSHNRTTGTPRRWLQMSNLTAVLFTIELTETCGNCSIVTAGDALFNDTVAIIKNGIFSGNLTKKIQSLSEWQIQAVVEPNSPSSNYVLKTDTPLNSTPTTSPLKFSFSPSVFSTPTVLSSAPQTKAPKPTPQPLKISSPPKPTYQPTSKTSKKPGKTPTVTPSKASKLPKRTKAQKDPRQSRARKRGRIPLFIINRSNQNSFVTTDALKDRISNSNSKLNVTHQASIVLKNISPLTVRKDDSSSSLQQQKLEDSANNPVASIVPSVPLNTTIRKHRIPLSGKWHQRHKVTDNEKDTML